MGNPAKAAAQEVEADEDEQLEDNEGGQEDTDEEIEAPEATDEPEGDDEHEESEGDANPEVEFEQAVNSAVKSVKRDAKGNLVFPKGMSPELKVAVRAEIRRRDTQADYTRTKQANRRLESERATLLDMTEATVELKLTQQQKDELDELKFSDPEAWHKQMNKLEREALQAQRTVRDEKLKQTSKSALEKEELEERKQILADFNTEHGIDITDDVIANDVPPRIVKRLETGEVTFEGFLNEVHEYLKTGKVVKQVERTRKQPNLSRVPGGSTPEKKALREDAIASYKHERF